MTNINQQLYFHVFKEAMEQHPTLKRAVAFLKPQINEMPSWRKLLDKATSLAKGQSDYSVTNSRVKSIFAQLLNPNLQFSSEYLIGTFAFEEDAFFPRESLSAEVRAETENMVNGLIADLEKIPYEANQIRNYTETLLNVLQKHTVTLPSGYGQCISFYDHAKMVAAIAVCLERYTAAGGTLEDNESLLLVGGSLSGIQDYIYDIISKNASKNLKGRSFYLQLQIDFLLQELVHALGLYQANIVYASGGGFYLLAPNTEEIRTTLETVGKAFAQKLFDTHRTKLFLEMSSVPLADHWLLEEKISVAWRILADKLTAQKRQKFSQQIAADKDGFAYFFEPSEIGGLAPRDVITNEELDVKASVFLIDDDTPLPKKYETRPLPTGENLVAEATNKQITLGHELKRKDYSVLSFGREVQALANQKAALIISKYITHSVQIDSTESADAYAFVNGVNNSDFLNIRNIALTANHIYGFSLYGGNDYPTINYIDKKGYSERRAKTFSELAGMKEPNVVYKEVFHEPKLKRLAVLRMDVDNLGTTFIRAFDKEEYSEAQGTLAAYSTLSRSLDYFFKGWLNAIWKSKDMYKEQTQIIYSGGDDLFIVGRWNATIALAKEIRTDFKRWICANPNLTLSGGIYLSTPKHPIVKAANSAKKAEDAAKEHSYGDVPKNAFTLFDHPLNWDYEFPVVESLKNQLVTFIEPDHIPSALISTILSFYKKFEEQVKDDSTQTWIWQISYAISRMKGRIKHQAAKDFLQELVNGIFTNRSPLSQDWEKANSKYSFFTLLYVAAQWAALELR
ncbi:MAG: hypothetical protein AAF960_18485 [Bacteroidota bacterium]